MLLIFSGHNIILNCTIYTAPTFTSLDLSVREDDGSLSVCIMGGITNETVAIQTQNKSNANSKLNKNCYNYRLKCFFSRLQTHRTSEGCGLGGARHHIKTFGPDCMPHSHQRNWQESLMLFGRYPLSMNLILHARLATLYIHLLHPPLHYNSNLLFLATTMMVNMNGLLII